MTDQLTLRLESDALPELPDLRPMLPKAASDAFDSADHLFEPWWGGARVLAFVGPADRPGAGAVRLMDADGVDRTVAFPELAGMAVRLAARSAILDGELVVVDAVGRSDAVALATRLGPMIPAAGWAVRPAAFLALDLLHLDGRSLLGQPLVRRREALRRVLRPGDEVVAVPAIATEGRALYEAAVGQGIAGVLARERNSPYLPGVRSRLWRFVAATSGRGSTSEADAEGEGLPVPGGTTAPVLALISRLPLDD